MINYLCYRGYHGSVNEMLNQNKNLQLNESDQFLLEWFDIYNDLRGSPGGSTGGDGSTGSNTASSNNIHENENLINKKKQNDLQMSYKVLAEQQRKLHKLELLKQEKIKQLASKSSAHNVPNPNSFNNYL